MGKRISIAQKLHYASLRAEAAALEVFVRAPGFNLRAAANLQHAMADTAAASRSPRRRPKRKDKG